MQYDAEETLIKKFLQHQRGQVNIASMVTLPKGSFKFPQASKPITLKSYTLLSDGAMHMHLCSGEENFKRYRIAGVTDDTKALVNERNEVLTDGWYQFVIMDSLVSEKPDIRYYASGEKQDGPSLSQQTGENNTNPILKSDSLAIYRQQSHQLSYDKFVAHSQLAGGKDVRAAGAFMIKNGQLKVVDDSSGHYALKEQDTDKYAALRVAQCVFQHFGVDTTNTIFERCKPYHGIDKLCKKVSATIFHPLLPLGTAKAHQLEATLAENRPVQAGFLSPIQVLCEIS